jgi:hypothetical protein
MAISDTYERAAHSRRYAVSLVDALAVVLGTKGPVAPPLGSISCEINRQIAPIAATFEPPLILWTIRNPSGFLICDGTYAREGSTASRFPLPDGTYRLRISGTYYQDLEFNLVWPPAHDDVRVPADNALLPSAAYPFPQILPKTFQEPPPANLKRPYSRGFTLIRGSVFEASGKPVEGAKAELVNFVATPFPGGSNPPPWTLLSCVTGESGDWAILLPDRLRFKNVEPTTTAPVTHPVTIRVTFPDASTINLTHTVPLGTEFSVTQTALRGRTVDTRGLPIAGVEVSTSLNADRVRSRDDGQWSLYFPLNQEGNPAVTVTATTAGGASQSATTAVVNGKTSVVPTFAFA